MRSPLFCFPSLSERLEQERKKKTKGLSPSSSTASSAGESRSPRGGEERGKGEGKKRGRRKPLPFISPPYRLAVEGWTRKKKRKKKKKEENSLCLPISSPEKRGGRGRKKECSLFPVARHPDLDLVTIEKEKRKKGGGFRSPRDADQHVGDTANAVPKKRRRKKGLY